MKKGFLNSKAKSRNSKSSISKNDSCCVSVQYCQSCDDDTLLNLNEKKAQFNRKNDILIYFKQLNLSTTDNNSTISLMIQPLKQLLIDIIDNNLQIYRNNHHLQSIFYQLSSDNTFTELLYPGATNDSLSVLPKNLTELMKWPLLELNYEKIMNSAVTVLEGVKRRGSNIGNIMDEETQIILIPQIIQESFARHVVESVHIIAKKLSQYKALSSPPLALPPADSEEFLDDLTLLSIASFQPPSSSSSSSSEVASVFRQSSFLGQEFCQLMYEDCIRYLEHEKMSEMKSWASKRVYKSTKSDTHSPSDPQQYMNNVTDRMTRLVLEGDTHPHTTTGRSNSNNASVDPVMVEQPVLMAWIEPSSIAELYPALAEGLGQLHMLPFEVNGKPHIVIALSYKSLLSHTYVIYSAHGLPLVPLRPCDRLLDAHLLPSRGLPAGQARLRPLQWHRLADKVRAV